VEFAKLFWIVAGFEDPALSLVLNAALNADERRVRNIVTLINSLQGRTSSFCKA
jgi:hypothetical protein